MMVAGWKDERFCFDLVALASVCTGMCDLAGGACILSALNTWEHLLPSATFGSTVYPAKHAAEVHFVSKTTEMRGGIVDWGDDTPVVMTGSDFSKTPADVRDIEPCRC